MNLYEKISTVGEGTYGIVMKCRNRETNGVVAIKMFRESEADELIRKTALREVRMLKHLKHENIVNLLDVFRRKGKIYLVMEHVDRAILADLEKNPSGLSDHREHGMGRRYMWQLLRAMDYLHKNNVIHRDIKPENILVSHQGIIKLCDFGFARALAGPGAHYTDYVATRWYRSPELLEYGPPVDVWAIGCILYEILTGQPLFPAETDIDQLYKIMRYCGPLTQRYIDCFQRNPHYGGVKVPEASRVLAIESKCPNMSKQAIDLMKATLIYDADLRITVSRMMQHAYFQDERWAETYELELSRLLGHAPNATNAALPSSSTSTATTKQAVASRHEPLAAPAPTSIANAMHAATRQPQDTKKDYVTGTRDEKPKAHLPPAAAAGPASGVIGAGATNSKTTRQTPSQWIASHYGAHGNTQTTLPPANGHAKTQKTAVESITKKAPMFPKISHLKASFGHH